MFTMGYFYPVLGIIGQFSLLALILLLSLEIVMLFRSTSGFKAVRYAPQRLSNGDENPIQLHTHNLYPFTIQARIIDEIPHQFQLRNFEIKTRLISGGQQSLSYSLRPTERGEYLFGDINAFISTQIGLISRRYRFEAETPVPVYPSFIQMRKFEMYAISNRLSDVGVKKIRRIGHTMEFDQIKEYVIGDDIRSINWKATARSNHLMVNQFQDERSQQVMNVIDMGRVMKMPFNGLHLLDYAINTSLVISNIALIKGDKAGLTTFSDKQTIIIKPEKKRTHIQNIQEALYRAETNFMESDYERLVISLKKHINQRSLLLLYTNFETLSSMERQLPYLKRLAKDHLLVTIFFENTEMDELLKSDAKTIGQIYTKTIAEKFQFEKKQIVKVLNQQGIQTILTPPEKLSINAINKYLELKARGMV